MTIVMIFIGIALYKALCIIQDCMLEIDYEKAMDEVEE